MAKPISPHRAACSASSTHSTTTAPRRQRKVPSPVPSSAVLAFLSTISASVVSVHASPAAPPSFLCPSFIPQPTPTRDIQERDIPFHRVQWAKKAVDDSKYVPDNCEDDAAASPTPFVDDQIQNPTSSSVPITTSAASTYTISLPPGWKAPGKSSTTRTTLILALSLVLAFVICFLIISCIFWRKHKRRKRCQNSDIETKAHKRRRKITEEQERLSILVEKEAKVKQKIWARATARWKANAKYAARQRRGRRIVSTTMANSPRSSCTLDRTEDEAATTRISSSPSSPAISPRSSMESMYAATRERTVTPSSHEGPGDVTLEASPPFPPPSPPAYHHNPEPRQPSSLHGASGLPYSVHGSSQSRYDAESSFPHDTPPSGSTSHSVHVAHVATDDKTLLARMADLASAPPPDAADSSHTIAVEYPISAPLWQDLPDFGDEPHQATNCDLPPPLPSAGPASPAHLFPSPPSKGKMAAPDFYNYPYTFDDTVVEPDPGPSAPPFEEESQHASNGTELTPSAPSLSETEPAYYNDAYLYPSAPAHDWDTTSLSSYANTYLPNQDTPRSSDDTMSDSRSSASSTQGSNPLVLQGPVASDGTPPCYSPS
ncbi:hypothetical protein C0991_007567 [Blastosporella zonata]|nr:hypothetical protein C0991_007567 [Blastosporella zonata]